MPQQKKRSAAAKQAARKKRAAQRAAAPARQQQRQQQRQPVRMSQAMRARVRRRRLIQAAVIAAVVAVIGAIVLSTFSGRRDDAEARSALEDAGCRVDRKSDEDAGTGRNHREGVRYEVDPPSGGDHAPSPLPPGRYAPDGAPDDQLVHSLEHGYVVIWHQPGLPEAELASLRDLQARFDRDSLLVERPALDVPVAATAWHRRALCSRVDAGALATFITTYRNKGPEKVPH